MEENQSTTPTPSEHLEVLLTEPLPSPALNDADIESVTNDIVRDPNHGRMVETQSVHSEKETEIISNPNRHVPCQVTPSLSSSSSYLRPPNPTSSSGSITSSKRAKFAYETSLSVLGVEANTILIVKAALSKCVPVFVYDSEIRFHKDLVGAKFVDTPSLLTRYSKVVFICQQDANLKMQMCTGKMGLFTYVTKEHTIVDVTQNSEYHISLFATQCSKYQVKSLNAPIQGLRSQGQIDVLLVSGPFDSYTNAAYMMQLFAKHVHFIDTLPLTAQRATTILAAVQAAKVLLVAEALAMSSHLGLELDTMQTLIDMNNGDIPTSLQHINAYPKGLPPSISPAGLAQNDVKHGILLADSHCIPIPLFSAVHEILKSQTRAQASRPYAFAQTPQTFH